MAWMANGVGDAARVEGADEVGGDAEVGEGGAGHDGLCS